MGSLRNLVRKLVRKIPFHREVIDYVRDAFTKNERLPQARIPEVLALFFQSKENYVSLCIGAHDGLTNDALAPYYQATNHEIHLVEPVEESYTRLVHNLSAYPSVRFHRCAISSANGNSTIYHAWLPDENTLLGQLSSLSRAKIERVLPTLGARAEIREEEIELVSFGSFLQKNSLHRLDLLKIDTEGHDYEILRSIPFGQIAPSVIVYEHVHLENAYFESTKLLRSHGYWLAADAFDTVAFAPHVQKEPWFGQWQQGIQRV